jgi:hypothetical protein
MAHLVFADTQLNVEKPKEPFFAIALTEKNYLSTVKFDNRINDIRPIH